MSYYVYMIKTIEGFRNKTYVGYTNNINLRLKRHNNNKGAKSTKGYKWELIFKRRFLKKISAMKFEYKLKKNKYFRKKLLNDFEYKN